MGELTATLMVTLGKYYGGEKRALRSDLGSGLRDLAQVIGQLWVLVPTCIAAAAKSPQSCPTLCNPTDRNQPGSPVHGILQARILEWVAISFSNAWKWKVKVKSLSRVWLLATSWTAAYQAPPSMGFSRQEYWSGVPLPSPTYTLLWFNCSNHHQWKK